MKKILYFLGAFAAAALCFSSCGEVEISVPETPGYHTVHFRADSPELKTVLAGDHANWVSTDADLFHVFENGVAPEKADDISVEFSDDYSTVLVTAIFPDTDATEFVYTGFVGNKNSNGNASVLTKQTPTDSSYDPNADILFAKPITTTDRNESLELEFQFTRVVALNKMTLKGIKEGETISKITLVGDKSIIGSFNRETMAYSANAKTLELTTSEDEVYFVTGPAEGITLSVTVSTDKASYSKTFAKTIDFVAGTLYEFGVTFTDEHRSTSDATYTLVNNVSSLKAGDVIVLGNAANSAAAGVLYSNNKYFTSVDATIEDGVLTSNNELSEIILGGSDGAWTLHTSEGYLAPSSSDLKIDNDEIATWTISISDSDATIAVPGTDPLNRFLYNAGSPRFKTYTSAASASMLLPQIYKKGGSVDPVEEVHVSSVSLNESEVSIKAGETVTLVPTVLPANADDKSVSWSSDDEDVATVSASGVVTGVAEGTAIITVTTTDGAKTASCEVTVTAVTNANYVKYSSELTEGDYIIFYNGNALKNTVSSNRLDYSTQTPSNNTITTSDMSIVWHLAQSGDYWTIYNAAVNKYAAATSTKNQAALIASGSDDKALWAVSRENDVFDFINKSRAAASSDSGNKYLRNNGSYGFACYASSTGGALTLYKLNDSTDPVSVTGVTLKASTSIPVGQSETLVPSISPANAVAQSISWSSSNESVATVDNGVVKAESVGESTITVTVDGQFSATCAVTVTSMPSSIADIRALITSTSQSSQSSFEATLTDAIVTYVSGKYAFIEDATSGILYYASANITNLVAGDKINGTVSGKGYIYNGLKEASTFDISKATKTSGATVPVTALTATELNANFERYMSCRVKLLNAAISTSAKTVDGIAYHIYNDVTMYDGNADVIGYPGCYTTPQFTIWEAPVYAATPLTGISLNQATASVAVGGTTTLTVTFTPGNATNKNVTWGTNNSAVATVAGGVVTGVAVGTATITATSEDGGFTASCTVTVKSSVNKTILDMTTSSVKCSAYNSTTTYGDWEIVYGANNNGGWTYFKMGGKSATISSCNPCSIYYKKAVSHNVSQVTVHIASGSLSKSGMSVKSWGVYVYSDSAMTNQIDYVAGGTITGSAADFVFAPTSGSLWASGCYFKVVWDLANTTTTNGIVCVDKITLAE